MFLATSCRFAVMSLRPRRHELTLAFSNQAWRQKSYFNDCYSKTWPTLVSYLFFLTIGRLHFVNRFYRLNWIESNCLVIFVSVSFALIFVNVLVLARENTAKTLWRGEWELWFVCVAINLAWPLADSSRARSTCMMPACLRSGLLLLRHVMCDVTRTCLLLSLPVCEQRQRQRIRQVTLSTEKGSTVESGFAG